MKLFNKKFNAKAPSTLFGIIIIGIIVSLLYDLVVKPGLSQFGRIILNAITFGSTTIRDYAYSQAALDPTSVSALILLLFIMLTPLSMLVSSKIVSIIKARINSDEQQQKSSITKKLIQYVFPLILLIMFSVHNQSIAIWRTFNANINIITPYISEKDKSLLVSQFSAMVKKSEYEKIHIKFSDAATKNNLILKDISLW